MPPSTLFHQIDRKIMPKTVHQATALCLSRSSDATVELHFSKCKLSVWTPTQLDISLSIAQNAQNPWKFYICNLLQALLWFSKVTDGFSRKNFPPKEFFQMLLLNSLCYTESNELRVGENGGLSKVSKFISSTPPTHDMISTGASSF